MMRRKRMSGKMRRKRKKKNKIKKISVWLYLEASQEAFFLCGGFTKQIGIRIQNTAADGVKVTRQ
jgi:hypothetical protein